MDTNDSSTYDKCKYVVKLWEHQFKKQHGRIPSKLDIREADKDIREAYKTYFHLKTAALEKSLHDVDLFSDDEDSPSKSEDIVTTDVLVQDISGSASDNAQSGKVWGDHLLRKEKETKKEKNPTNTKSSFTEKLLKNTKPLKRFQRKSLSFHKRKSENNLSEQKSLSQPDPVDFQNCFHENDSTTADPVLSKFTIFQKPLEVKSTNIIQSILTDNYKQRESVDKNWLNRIISPEIQSNDIEKENTDYNSDDVIAESDEEETLHVTKKSKLITNNMSNCKKETDSKVINVEKSVECSSDSLKKLDVPEIINRTNRDKNTKLRPTKVVSFKENSDEEDDLYRFKSDDESSEEESKEKPNKKGPKRRANIAKESKATNNDNYELEFSVRSRISTNPRIENVKKVISTAIIVNKELKRNKLPVEEHKQYNSTKESAAERKLLNKIESGKLNENYISLNMKKKIFVRGKKNTNFSKIKKKQWKDKKKQLYGVVTNNCSTDRQVCFTCGESGHWARQCPNKKGEELLPLEADTEDCVCPTLEEATEMARTSVLTVRTPNIDNNSNNKSSEPSQNLTDDETDGFEDSLPIEFLQEVDKLEEEVRKADLKKYIDSTKFVEPFYKLDNGKIIETPKEVFKALSKFGFSEFRAGQEKAVMRILSGLSTLVTLSTGAGKSLCYQLPAYLYSKREPCITLVVSPLVSLMEDQVQGVPHFLKAACLHTGQTKTQKEKVQAAIDSGELNVLLVSPEAIVAGEKSAGLGTLLRKLPPIAFACIDEVHCVSQWSHNFRPSYLMICRVLRERFGVKTLLGLTATATRSTCESIIEHLHIPDGKDGVVSEIPLPRNLHLSVSRDVNRDSALLHLLSSEKFAECRSIIVYCTRREECERVATLVRTSLREPTESGRKRKRYSDCAEAYHAGLSAARRKSIQKSFMGGELRIVVATVAFGMGINKSDIRSVIHYNMPSSIESYVQEVGRAGRDGLPSFCHLFLNSESNDEYELRRHVFANTVDRHAIRKLLQRVFVPCSCKGKCTKHEVAFSIQETVAALDVPEENIETLLCYLELHEKKYIETLSHAYINCKVVSYGNVNVIAHASKDCIPLAMALALHKDRIKGNVFEFPVIDVAAAIGWDSGICKHKLKNLEWVTVNNQPTRSKLNVQFTNLGFRVLAPGNLSDNELDEALEYLFQRVQEQERTALLQIRSVQNALASIAVPSVKSPPVPDDPLKDSICDYFNKSAPLENLPEPKSEPIDKDRIASDARALIVKYRDENFTGRAIARIFHGIQSPNYPAFQWGRCGFWRTHLRNDFNVVCDVVTKEILRMKTGIDSL